MLSYDDATGPYRLTRVKLHAKPLTAAISSVS